MPYNGRGEWVPIEKIMGGKKPKCKNHRPINNGLCPNCGSN